MLYYLTLEAQSFIIGAACPDTPQRPHQASMSNCLHCLSLEFTGDAAHQRYFDSREVVLRKDGGNVGFSGRGANQPVVK